MKKDNWRFEALARGRIARQEEEEKELLRACKIAKGLLEGLSQANIYKLGNVYNDLTEAIDKAEGKE